MIRESAAAAIAGALMGCIDGAPLPRPPAGEGGRARASRRRGTRTSRTTTSTARQTCSVWMPVDPVSREATLEFVAGSHLGPWLMPRTFMDDQARWFPEGSLEELPDIEADRAFRSSAGRSSRATPSSSTCSRCTPRAARPTRRRAFSIRFLGDDVVHAPRAWTTSPDVPRPRGRAPRRRADGPPAASRSSGRPETPVPGTCSRVREPGRRTRLGPCDSSPHSSHFSSPRAAAVAAWPEASRRTGGWPGVVWGGRPICPTPTGKDSLTCHPTPLANGVFVVSGGGTTRRVHADANGRFRVALPPGRYAVRPGLVAAAERSASWPAASPTSAWASSARR